MTTSTIHLSSIPGPGVMGFQPAIFDSAAGDITWSPFWVCGQLSSADFG